MVSAFGVVSASTETFLFWELKYLLFMFNITLRFFCSSTKCSLSHFLQHSVVLDRYSLISSEQSGPRARRVNIDLAVLQRPNLTHTSLQQDMAPVTVGQIAVFCFASGCT